MWCAHCQSEVAAEASPETGQIRCASCGNEIASGKFARLDQNLRDAKELLDRWSREPLLEPYGPLPGKARASVDEIKQAPLPVQTPPETTMSTEPHYRIDPPAIETPNPVETPQTPPSEPIVEAAPVKPVMESKPIEQVPVARQTRIEPEHKPTERNQPHLDIQALIEEKQSRLKEPPRNSFMVMAGQWLSYLGILGLTAGASLVVYGYFGNQPGLTPKGWMLTTAGQMLLFLGIVTLISGGMEQATDEMSRKIQILGDQMLRFEKHTREQLLRGPKIPVEAYADGTESEKSLKSGKGVKSDQQTAES